MKPKALVAAALAVSLSACATLYSTSRDWKLPAGLGNYTLSATMSASLFTWEATISVNGKEVLTGQSFFWSDTVTMSGTVDRLPVAAVCNQHEKTCDVSIAGIHAAVLRF